MDVSPDVLQYCHTIWHDMEYSRVLAHLQHDTRDLRQRLDALAKKCLVYFHKEWQRKNIRFKICHIDFFGWTVKAFMHGVAAK